MSKTSHVFRRQLDNMHVDLTSDGCLVAFALDTVADSVGKSDNTVSGLSDVPRHDLSFSSGDAERRI
jgi:hypothetical protein